MVPETTLGFLFFCSMLFTPLRPFSERCSRRAFWPKVRLYWIQRGSLSWRVIGSSARRGDGLTTISKYEARCCTRLHNVWGTKLQEEMKAYRCIILTYCSLTNLPVGHLFQAHLSDEQGVSNLNKIFCTSCIISQHLGTIQTTNLALIFDILQPDHLIL